MIGSPEYRRTRDWIAGAGLACLGATSILYSGCSTTTVSDTHGPAKASQQIARSSKAKSKDVGKSTSRQVAAKDPPGRVRISDRDDLSQTPAAVAVAQKNGVAKPQGAPAAATQARPIAGGTAARPAINPAAPAGQTPAASPAGAVLAAQSKRPGASGSSKPNLANTIAAKRSAEGGAIRQTAGTRQGSPPQIANRSQKSSEPTRPVINPAKTEWQSENGGEVATSNYDRRRADRLMQNAQQMYKNGYPEEALRLASIAAELEKSHQAVYKRGEERPSEFIAMLMNSSGASISPAGDGFDQAVVQKAADMREGHAQRLTAGVEPKAYRRSGERKPAGRGLSATRKISTPPAASILTAVDPQLARKTTPRFASDESDSQHAGAISGLDDAPVATTLRSADASVVTAEGRGSLLDQAPLNGKAEYATTSAASTESKDGPAASALMATASVGEAKSAAAQTSALETGTSESGAVDYEIEPLAEIDAPATAPAQASQMTIGALIGLVSGIAGMFGLSWWRRQERKHYEAEKRDVTLRIQDVEPAAPVRRAA